MSKLCAGGIGTPIIRWLAATSTSSGCWRAGEVFRRAPRRAATRSVGSRNWSGATTPAAPTAWATDGVILVFLPPSTPELQPAERLWTLANKAVADNSVKNIVELEQVLAERCRILCETPTAIRSATLWHWWPEQIAPNES